MLLHYYSGKTRNMIWSSTIFPNNQNIFAPITPFFIYYRKYNIEKINHEKEIIMIDVFHKENGYRFNYLIKIDNNNVLRRCHNI